jgi:hypothetical protein
VIDVSPIAMTLQGSDLAVVVTKTTSTVATTMKPYASKPPSSTKTTSKQMPLTTDASSFKIMLSLFKHQSKEWSSDFNHLLNKLVDAKHVTLPTISPKSDIGYSKVRLRDNLHRFFS